MQNKVILEVSKISKSFPGTKALSDVSLQFYEGEVHALVGENGAGKSTLMNIISSVFPTDSGDIFYKGEKVHFQSTKDSQNAGIGFVHQELALCQHVSVAENIFIGRLPVNSLGIVNKRVLLKNAEDILSMFKTRIEPSAIVMDISIADQQVVEIAKALALDCRVIIFDEPTSSLTDEEIDSLLGIIVELKNKGICIIYISHRLKEIFRVCERVSVLRDGVHTDTLNISETSPREIVNKMVGRELSDIYPEKSGNISDVIFKVDNFNKPGFFKDISFELRKGEILGLAGLVGAGRTEVSRAICGIDPCSSGDVFLENRKIHFKKYRDAIKNGVCYLTEDRKAQGLFLEMDIVKNMTVSKIDEFSEHSIINFNKAVDITEEFCRKLKVKFSSIFQNIGSLSGGNQQKVMIAKWLTQNPKVLIMDEPTRGIDVGAKAEIHKMLRELSIQGLGIIVISSELPEIIGMSDRVLVMHEGEISGEVSGAEMSEERIMTFASGQHKI